MKIEIGDNLMFALFMLVLFAFLAVVALTA